MGWQNTLLQLSPLIIDLASIAEKAFNNQPKSGEQKKEFVHNAVKDIVTGGEQVATGGAKETWTFIGQFVPPLIDIFSKHLFPHHTESVPSGNIESLPPVEPCAIIKSMPMGKG